MKCGECQYFDSRECHRWPPDKHGFPLVNSESWCGEFKEVVKREVFPPSPPPPPPEPEVKKRGWPKGMPRKVAV